jgi:hypothetical protein
MAIKIGWSQTDITPISEAAQKVDLQGQWYRRYSSEVHDPIHAVVLALDSGEGLPIILVSAELVAITAPLLDAARAELKKLEPSIPSEALLMCATHVHTGPALKDREPLWGGRFGVPYRDPEVLSPQGYTVFFAKKVAAAAAEAWKKRKPGGIALKTGRIAVPQCRRVQYKDGTSLMYGNTNTPNFLRIEGAADNGAEYLITFDEIGKITGTVINLACPAQIVEMAEFISADYWGEVRRQWPQMPYILPVCGAAGDLTMRDLVRRHRSEADDRGWEGVIDIAGRIVRESKYIVSTVKKENIKYEVPVKHIKWDIMLPLWTVSDDVYKKAKREYDAFEKEYHDNKLADTETIDDVPLRMKDRQTYAYLAARVKRWEMQQQNIENMGMELHALRFGDGVLVTNPFELYQEFGNQIKALSPAPYTFIAQLANDCLGYLCNSIAVLGGSYSSSIENGFVGPEGGDILVKKSLDAIDQVWN